MADGAIDARLVVQLEARVDKLQASLSKSNSLIARFGSDAQKTLDQANGRFNSFGSGLPKSLEKNLAQSRAKLSGLFAGGGNLGARVSLAGSEAALAGASSLTSRFGLLGGAMTALGPAGLAAAAGILAVGAAADKAIKAADWAKEIERLSTTTGLTTTQIQLLEFQFAGLGVPVEQGIESMKGFAAAVGAVQSGLARPIATKAFTGLGITPEQLRSWGDLQTILPHVLDSLAKLNAPEIAGFAKRLRMDPEVLASLVAGRGAFADLAAQAQRYGIVVSDSVIKQSAAAADKLHVAATIAKDELTVAFAGAAPSLVGFATKMADAAKAMKDFIADCGDALTPIANLLAALDRLPHDIAIKLHLETPDSGAPDDGRPKGFVSQAAGFVNNNLTLGGSLRALGYYTHELANEGRRQDLVAGVKSIATGKFPSGQPRNFNDSFNPPDVTQPPAVQTIPTTTHGGKGNAGQADEIAGKLDEANKALAEALKNLTTDIDARAAFEKQAVEDERKKSIEALDAEEKRIGAAKGVKDKSGLTAQLEQAKLAVNATAIAKNLLIDQQLAEEKAKAQLEVLDAQLTGQKDVLEAQLPFIRALDARTAVQLRILALEEQEAEAKEKEVLADPRATPAAKQVAQANLDTLQTTYPLKQRQITQDAAEQAAKDRLDLENAQLDAERELLKAQEPFATTMKERLAIQLRLLAIEEQQLEDAQRAIINNPNSTPTQVEAAQANLGGLQAAYPLKQQETAIQASPLKAFAQQQQQEYGDLGEDAQKVDVEGIEALNNGLVEAALNFRNLGDVARSVLRQIEADLLRTALNAFESKALGGLFGLAGGGLAGTGGGSLGDMPAGYGGGSGPGAADGGPIDDLPGYPGGGRVSGAGTGRTDSILSRLSHGEYVVPAAAVRRPGVMAMLEAVRAGGSVPGYANGGPIGSVLRMPQIGPAVARGGGPDIHYHLEGSVMTQDLVDQMNAINNAGVDRAVGVSLAAGRRSFFGQQTRTNLLEG